MAHESERDDDGRTRGIVEFRFKAPRVRFACTGYAGSIRQVAGTNRRNRRSTTIEPTYDPPAHPSQRATCLLICVNA